MTTESIPVQLWQKGYSKLVSVIPPNAPLSPNSRVQPSQLGKTPGIRHGSGAWSGYAWLTAPPPSIDDVRSWVQWGANVGLEARYYPAIDIDCLDPWLSSEVEKIAKAILGPAPVRIGRAPKKLLMYRTAEPFARMAAVLKLDGASHLVECLGAGRQYLVHGTHPSGASYSWDRPVWEHDPSELTPITRDQVERFFVELGAALDPYGIELERLGDGKIRDTSAGPQAELKAPDLETLAEAVACIPNDDRFQERDDYIRFGYAVKAAGQDDDEAAFSVFLEWAQRWEDGANDPDTVRLDWRKMQPPFAIGWHWLAELAKQNGFNAAATEFEIESQIEEVRASATAPVDDTDHFGADLVAKEHADTLRFSPVTGKWYVWDGCKWRVDALNLAINKVEETCRAHAASLNRIGATEAEKKANKRRAEIWSSTARRNSVLAQVETDPRLVISPDVFDTDPMVLNTPGGVVDLASGRLGPHSPVQLHAKSTLVAPDFAAVPRLWLKFLSEATNGDQELESYLRRLAGYCLTGSIKEHACIFLWGVGGNGKGTYADALSFILGDYFRKMPMDAFIASQSDRHPTELAGLLGARLAVASESSKGAKWNESRLKELTGGDPVTARFMRQDFFTFAPQFKLIFLSNNKPELQEIDRAIRRRLHLVPFVHIPPVMDLDLPKKLVPEYPAILAWMIKGCLEWQQQGLNPPAIVRSATEEYFLEQDPMLRWKQERTDDVPGEFAESQLLYNDFAEWAANNGERPGSHRRFAQGLDKWGLAKDRHPTTRRNGFYGLRLRPKESLING